MVPLILNDEQVLSLVYQLADERRSWLFRPGQISPASGPATALAGQQGTQ